MNKIVNCSLVLNIVVLIPVCLGIMLDAHWVLYGWGIRQPSLEILVSIYVTILLASVYLLIQQDHKYIFGLLALQVIYKLLTVVFVGNWHNPVMVSNFIIAIVHSVSLVSLYKELVK